MEDSLTTARITVGMPAYANAKTIAAAIESVLAQSYKEFVLVISDDGSPDETPEICGRYLRLDDRVRYVRQPRNLRYQNFGWLLRECQTEYFVWLAGDDCMAPDFLEKCVLALDEQRQAVLVVPQVQFHTAGAEAHIAKGTYALEGNHEERVLRFLSFPSDNSRMYGLLRTRPGQAAFPEESFHAWDWAFSLATLKYGQHLQLDEVLLHRDLTPSVNYIRMVDTDARNPTERAFPLWGLLLWSLRHGFLPARLSVGAAMLDIFLGKHVEYCVVRWPRYGRAAAAVHRFLRRNIFWRFMNGSVAARS